MTTDDFPYASLDDEELVAELRKRVTRMKQLLIEIRDLLREASSVD